MPSLLKSLELKGYKTFANSTVFEFSRTVTAIVGPNGSGKSNIADALRWVLGEQSYSLLRGKKTEDMIFSGSEQRSRAGMASATVTFDNSDSWLPIDFSEVAITRRAYRDGQNEYLLNGQRVRLRDVSELLAQSGLAERTYTIIGQGLVDAALSLKAEERRRLFEEAAGIGLHRSRREESLRRLETTQRNLERVQDILSELQPRLRSLERQARRAREYEQVKADLREVLRIWYGYHWNRAQKELAEAQASIRKQEVSLEAARKEQEVLESQLETARNEIQILRTNLSDWQRQLQEIQNNRHDIERDLAIVGERQHYLELQHQDIQDQLSRSLELVEILEKRGKSARGDVQEKESELAKARLNLEAAEKDLNLFRSQRDQVEMSLQEIRDSKSEIENRKLVIEAKLKENRAQLERQRASRELLAKVISDIERDLQSFELKTLDSEQVLKEAQKSSSEIQALLSVHHEKYREIESIQNETNEQEKTLKTEENQLRARLEIIEQSEQTLTGYASGRRVIMTAAQQMRLSGVLGILNQQIEVHPDLEVAITAALGEYLEAVLFENRGEAVSAVALLSSEGVRGAILPLDSLEPGRALRIIKSEDGVIGYAADHVATSQELRPVVDLLLGQVLIVRDREVAGRILGEFKKMRSSRGNENDWGEETSPHISGSLRVVTINGEVFYASGPIMAGREGDSARLQYPQQRQALSKLLEDKANRIQVIEEQRKEQEKELADAKIEGEILDRRLEDKRVDVKGLESTHSHNIIIVERTQQQLEWRKEQLDSLDKEIGVVESLISEIPDQLKQLEINYQYVQEKFNKEKDSVQVVSIEEYQKEVTNWSMQVAIIERDAAEAINRYRERQEAYEDEKRNYEETELRVIEIEKTRKELKSQNDDLRIKEKDYKDKIENLHYLITPAESNLKSKEAEERRISEQERKSRQALNIIDHQHAQVRIILARKQESLESLRRRIQDDFGLVDFEYVDEISGPTPLPFEGIVEQLPLVRKLSPEVESTIKQRRALFRRIGEVNPDAQGEYQEVKERHEFLTEQIKDLEKAQIDIRRVISDLNTLMEEAFQETFNQVADEFHNIFGRLFGGGTARLVLTDPEDLTTTGIDIEARLPGRREQGLSLLSGGERSLTATALVFSLLRVSPTPFCVLDEVDAMLDEANVGRFRELLRELSESTQFIIITHNRNTVQVAEVMYGVTMSRDSTSQVISLKMDEVGEIVD